MKQSLPPNSNLSQHHKTTYKSFCTIMGMVLTITLSGVYVGYCLVYLGTIDIDVIFEKFNVQQGVNKSIIQGFLNGCIQIGALFGALGSSILMHRLSRRYPHYYSIYSLLSVNIFAFIINILLYIPTLPTLFIFRICQGMCIGFYSSKANLIINEIVPKEIMGSIGSLYRIMMVVGLFVGSLLPLITKIGSDDFTGGSTWHYIFGFPFVLLILQTLLLIFLYPYETVKYLLMKGRQQEALELIRIIYKEEFVDEIFKEKKHDIQTRTDNVPLEIKGSRKKDNKVGNSSDVSKAELVIQKKEQNQDAIQQNKKEKEQQIKREDSNQTKREQPLSQSPLQSQPIISPKSCCSIQLSLAIHISMLIILSGNMSIAIYGVIIGQQSLPQIKQYLGTIMNGVQLVAVLFTSCTLAKYGRRTVFNVGSFLHGIADAVIGIGFFLKASSYTAGIILIFLGLISSLIFFNIFLGATIWIYLQQILQPHQGPYPTAVYWLTASIVIILFPIITEQVLQGNPGALFMLYALWCFFGLFINLKYLVETKNKTEKQVRKDFEELVR